jgi:predicted nucleic acid-binding protein
MKSRIFFDTNVLVYSIDRLSSFHSASRKLFEKAINDEIHGIISDQNIFELIKVLTNSHAMRGTPLRPKVAINFVSEFLLSGSFQIIYSTTETLKAVLNIISREISPTKNIFDIRLGVQAIQAKAETIATYNKSDFKDFQMLKILRPEEIE